MADGTVATLTYSFRADVGALKQGLAEVRGQIQQMQQQAQASSREMARGMDDARQSVERLSAGARIASNALRGMITAAAFAIFSGAVTKAISDVAELGTTARLAGISLRDMLALQQATAQSGGTSKGLQDALQGIAKAANEATRDENEFKKILDANGVSLTDNAGKLRSTMDLLLDYSNLVKNAKTEQDKLVLLEAIGSGRDMVTFFERGALAIRALTDEARTAGNAIDDNIVKKATEFDRAWKSAWETWATTAKAWIVDVGANLQTLYNKMTGGGAAAFNAALMGGDAAAAGGGGNPFGGLSRPSQWSVGGGLAALRGQLGGAGSKGGTVIPDKGGGGGGEKEAVDQIARYIERLQEAQKIAQAELDTWNKGNVERAKAVELIRAESVAKREGKTLTDEQKKAITDAAGAAQAMKDRVDELKQKQQELNQLARQWADAFTNALDELIVRGGKLKNVIADLARSLASMSLRGLLTGTNGGGGLLGSLFGGLFNGFKGFFAEGGTIPAGAWGIAGERGPELITGPATVTPPGKMGGGSSSVSVHNYAAGVKVEPRVTPNGVMLIVREAIDQNNRQLPSMLAEHQARSF